MNSSDAEEPRAARAGGWLITLSGLIVVLGVGLVLRAMNAVRIFTDDGVLFFGNDAFYHMRRVAYGLQHWPEVLHHDPYHHFPEGAAAIWPPAFDVAVTALLRLAGVEALASAERWAAWVPVGFGLLTILLLFPVARLVGCGRGGGLAGATALAMLGGHVFKTHVGFLDHHSVMGFLTAGTLATLVWSWPGRRGSWVGATVLGGWLGLSLLVWPGCSIFSALCAAFVVGWAVWTRREGALARQVLLRPGAWALAVAAACVWFLRPPLQDPDVTFTLNTVSALQPVLLGCGAVGLAVAALVQTRRAHLSVGVLVLTLLLASAASLGACTVGLSGFDDALRGAYEWVAKDEAFQARVFESQPLWQPEHSWKAGPAVRDLSLWFYALPLLALALLVAGVRARQPGKAFAGLCSLVFVGLALLQQRFVDLAAVPVALTLGWWCGVLVRGTAGRLNAAPLRITCGAVVTLVWLAGFWPMMQRARLTVPGAWAEWRGTQEESLAVDEKVHRERARMARWLRDRTEPTEGLFDPDAKPAYGVFCSWTSGHIIEYVGQRPTIVNNFGDDLGGDHFADSLRLVRLTDGDEALALLDRYRARYLVTEPPSEFDQDLTPESIGWRLHFDNGLDRTTPGAASLAGLRLVYESSVVRAGDLENAASLQGGATALFKVWQRVPGARVRGAAPPGTTVRASIRMRTSNGRTFRFLAKATADATGQWEVSCPYSSRPGSAVGPVEPGLTVVIGERKRTIRIPEVAVLQGGVVPAGGP